MKLFPFALLIITFMASYSANAASADGDDAVEQLRQALVKTMPQVKPTKISSTPVNGLYEVIVGTQVVYMDINARYMIEGDLFDLKTKVNVTEGAKSVIRLAAVDKLGSDNMIIYTPKKIKNTITVVTDIDCPYCRRLHDEIPDYLENEIQVRYIFMPLKGPADMRKTISVWCSDDQQLALDMAKAGVQIEEKTCKNPIKKHMKVAREMGIRGTPAILLEDGTLLPGYVPVDKLVAELRK